MREVARAILRCHPATLYRALGGPATPPPGGPARAGVGPGTPPGLEPMDTFDVHGPALPSE